MRSHRVAEAICRRSGRPYCVPIAISVCGCCHSEVVRGGHGSTGCPSVLVAVCCRTIAEAVGGRVGTAHIVALCICGYFNVDCHDE